MDTAKFLGDRYGLAGRVAIVTGASGNIGSAWLPALLFAAALWVALGG